MNFLSKLPKIVKKKSKRLGRGTGSGKGAKSTRGTTRHQKARENIPLHFEGGQGKITKKYPLLRGKGKNKSIKPRPIVVKLHVLNQFKENSVIDIESLIKNKVVDEKAKKVGVKILNGGKLEKKLVIKTPISSSAKKLVEKIGGKVES